MSRDRSRRALPAPALALALTIASLGCDPGGDPGAAGIDAAPAAPAPALALASRAEADAMAPPPAAELLRRAEAEERAALAALPAGAGHDLVLSGCIGCHSATMIAQQHKDSAGWAKTVSQMVAWGAPVAAAQQPVLVAYLAEHYPARARSAPARAAP